MYVLTKRVLLALAVLVGSVAAAAEFAVPEETKVRLDRVLERSGGHLTYFEGPSEMIGVGITLQNGQQMVVYATPDGKTVFSGVAVDTDTGENRTRADLARLPEADFGPAFASIAEALAEGGEGSMVAATEGDRGAEHAFYVFIDPRCPYCHTLKHAFESVQAKGHDVVVHYIPIGILGPESQNLASAMAGSPNAEAMAIFKAARGASSVPAGQDAIAVGAPRAAANLAKFRALSFEAVPAVVSRAGGRYGARQGGMSVEMILSQIGEGEDQVARRSGP